MAEGCGIVVVEPFRLLVFGSRFYRNVIFLTKILCEIHEKRPIGVLGEGEAPGADTLAREWADLRGVKVEKYFADWNRYGKSAGPRRNERQLYEFKPHAGVAFFGPNYRGSGSLHMASLLEKAGIPVAKFYE